MSRAKPLTCFGSSPRGRGKPPRRPRSDHRNGLIPARAGKTQLDTHAPTMYKAHPRAGGENFGRLGRGSRTGGSSPRGRGKRSRAWSPTPTQGLIPARAGKTTCRSPRLRRARAHPRAGGENDHPVGTVGAPMGSSPRGRGKPGCGCFGGVVAGLIPARAGKTRP